MDQIRFEIAAARRILARAGLDPDDIAGQVTARAVDEDAIWATPLGLFDDTFPDDVVKLPFGTKTTDGRVIHVAGAPVPVSTASAWVEAIYRARSDVNCVIHTHAPHIGAVATTGDVVQLYNNRSLIFYDEQAFYDDDGTHTDSPQRIVAALGSRSVLIMRNHGAVVTGESVPVATAATVLLEAAARFQVLGMAAGGTPFADHEGFAQRKRPHRANLDLVWDAHLRRLRHTDPALFEVHTLA